MDPQPLQLEIRLCRQEMEWDADAGRTSTMIVLDSDIKCSWEISVGKGVLSLLF
jgi:hypothetical protein